MITKKTKNWLIMKWIFEWFDAMSVVKVNKYVRLKFCIHFIFLKVIKYKTVKN